MDDLAQWLGEQYDEDVRRASSWHTLECDIHAYLQGDLDSVKAALAMFHEAPGAVCDCGVPARVLREIDAKRQALAHFERIRQRTRHGELEYVLAEGAVRTQIQFMAAAYNQRPGYLEKWRP